MKKIFLYVFLGLMFTNFASALPKCKGTDYSKWTNCQGTIAKDGAKYVGEIKNGKGHGQGTITFPDGGKYVGELKDNKMNGQGTLTSPDGETYVGGWKDGKQHGQGTLTKADGTIDNGIWKNDKLVKRNTTQTQIAKKEPTQTQQVAGKVSYQSSLTLPEEDVLKGQLFGCWSIPLGMPYGENLLVRIKLKLRPDGTIIQTEILDHTRLNAPGQSYFKVLAESVLRALRLCQPLRVPKGGYENWKDLVLNFDAREMLSDDIQIAKNQSTIKPKKKKKVKVAETTQEEFKPVDKDIDNDPPRIEIVEAITVVSQSYTIKGTVRDKSKPIYLEINGRPVEVKNGKFELERFNIDPDVVEELKIVAIDPWNNRSEKLVKVTVELQSTEVVRTYEELRPNRVKVKTDKDKIAIIIGIEKYVNLTNLDAPFANRDAKAFKAYATRALGVKSSNIKLLVDDKAGRPQILEAFKLWLPRIAADGGKDIYIFFSGHGLASDNGEDLYILPQNGNSLLLEDTAITRVKLISLIQKVNPNSVTMFFDTCYSGQTREERMLVASLKPIRIVADEQDTPNNFTIFSASNFDQTSGTIKEAKYGMFSYYLMKGLEGKADGNKDDQITNGELIAYLKTNVGKEAFTQNREQDPMLSGDPDQVLMKY